MNEPVTPPRPAKYLGLFRRKQYLINPRFQFAVILFFLLMSFLTALFNYLVVYQIFNDFMHKGKMLGLPKEHIYFKFIGEQLSTFNTFYLVSTALLVLMFVIGGIVFSNKIAGPMYRLHRHLNELTKTGKDLALNFRKKDFFLEIPEAFNNYLNSKTKRKDD